MRAHWPAFREVGAGLAAVGLGDHAHARRFRAETGLSFPLLVDARREAYAAAGLGAAPLRHVLRPDNLLALVRARRAGHRQEARGRDPFQLGGTFAFGPGDVDLHAHVNRTFGDTADPADVLAALRRC